MIAKLSTWTLFWIGHWFSVLFEVTEFEFLYDAYSWCMGQSCNIQDAYDVQNGPWISVEEEETGLNSSDEM